jgi:hypothetical protein
MNIYFDIPKTFPMTSFKNSYNYRYMSKYPNYEGEGFADNINKNNSYNYYFNAFIGFLFNLFYAIIIFFFGGFGILAMRIMKGVWLNQLWSYIPIFWIPITTSWVVSIGVLLGFFDT